MLTFTLETRKPRWREIMIKHDWERSKGEERGDGWLDMISVAVCMVSVYHRDTECCKYVGLISVHDM